MSGKVSIDCGAIFKVGSCECLSFASICCLVGGWLLGGIFRAVPDERKSCREGDGEEIFMCMYIQRGKTRGTVV